MSTLAEQVVEQLKTDMDNVYDAGYQKGKSEGGEDFYQYATALNFQGAAFPSGYDLVLNIPNFNGEQSGGFQKSKGLKSIKLICNDRNVSTDATNMFSTSNSILETIDLTEFSTMFRGVINFCLSQTKLVRVLGDLDVSNVTNFLNIFLVCNALQEVRFVPKTIKYNIAFAHSPLLSDESIQSIIDGLADLTGQTSQTLTLHADVKAKLTEEQIATITSKNWTLA